MAQIVLTTMHEELEKVAQSMDAKVNPHKGDKFKKGLDKTSYLKMRV